MGVNHVILAGNIGLQPKVINKGDFKVAKLSVATTMYRNKSKITDWHNVDAYGINATFIENNVNKGDYVVVTGYLTTTVYKDKNGVERKSYSVKVRSIELVKVKRTGFAGDAYEDAENDDALDDYGQQPENEPEDMPY